VVANVSEKHIISIFRVEVEGLIHSSEMVCHFNNEDGGNMFL
jgi:hypothetical protein